MDYDTLLFWLIAFFSLFGLIGNLVRIRSTGPGWLLVFGSILALDFAGAWLNSAALIYAAAACWFLFGCVPGILSRACFRLVLRQQYGPARRWALLMSWLHPLDGWRTQPKLIRTLALSQQGDLQAAIAGLAKYKEERSTTSITTVIALFRLTNQWQDMMAWDKERQRELDRLPHLLHARLRARGETQDFQGLLDLYERNEAKIARLNPAALRDLCRLMLYAFSGKRVLVERLFAGRLAALPAASQKFWLASSDLYAGSHEEARSQLESLRSEADPNLRLAIDHRLSHLAAPTTALDQAAEVLIQKASLEQDHEERFGTAPKLLSRHTRATQLIIVLNLGMFAVEIFQGGSTNMETLYRLGALYAPAIRSGEWWRLPASMFLHLGPVHLAMNMIALWVLAPFVEFALGFRRFLFTYLISGLGSMAVVYALASRQAAEQLTVGASGSIMGLVGATGALMLRGWLRHKASVARRRLIGMITILLTQSAFDALVPQVSMKAHLSGAAIGFLLTLLLRDRLQPEGG